MLALSLSLSELVTAPEAFPVQLRQVLLAQGAPVGEEVEVALGELGVCHLRPQQLQRAEQVGDLEQPVSAGCRLAELDIKEERVEQRVEHVRDLRLPIVIVDNDAVEGQEVGGVVLEEAPQALRDRSFELEAPRVLPLAEPKRLIGEGRRAGKREQPGEDSLAGRYRQRLVVIFAPDDRPGVDRVIWG